MRKAEDYIRLIEQLALDMHTLAELEMRRGKAERRLETARNSGTVDELDWAALGYTIHNIYCSMENYFLRVTRFFENSLEQGSWHRELLERMNLELPGIRPRLFDRAMVKRVDELRRFRHAFRNVYDGELDPAKVDAVDALVPGILADFREAHESFLLTLRQVLAGLRP